MNATLGRVIQALRVALAIALGYGLGWVIHRPPGPGPAWFEWFQSHQDFIVGVVVGSALGDIGRRRSDPYPVPLSNVWLVVLGYACGGLLHGTRESLANLGGTSFVPLVWIMLGVPLVADLVVRFVRWRSARG